MTEHVKYREGMILFDRVKGPGTDLDGMKQALFAASPLGRLKMLKDLARQVGVECDDLEQTETLIEQRADYHRIDGLLKQAKYKIQLAAHEPIYPLAARGKKNQDGNREGGLNSHGLTKEERKEMYSFCQNKINELCLEKGLGYKAACLFVSKNLKTLRPKDKIWRDTISVSSLLKETTCPY